MADDSVDLGVADYLANPEQAVAPRLKDSLLYGVQQQPDVQAQTKVYARKLGVPLPSALSDPKYVKAQGMVDDLDPNGMVRGSPKTANWLAEPDNAAVAHDDVDVLKNIEQTIKNLGSIAKGSAYTLDASVYGAAQAVNEFIDPFGEMGLGRRRQVDMNTRQVIDTGPATALEATRKSLANVAQAAMPTTENWIQAGVNSGVASLLQNAPTVALALATKNPELALSAMALQTGGTSYGEARDAGVAPFLSAFHAAKQGYIEGLTEKLPVESLVGDLKAGSGILKTWMHQMITEVPGEELATAMQDYNDWADLHPEQPFSQYIAQRGSAAGETLIATMMGTTGHTALEQVAHAAEAHLNRQATTQEMAAQAKQSHEMLDGLMKAAQGSALRERDPQTFHDYVDAVTQDGPVSSVYVNAHDLVDVLAQGNPDKLAENAQVLEAMPSVGPQLEDAMKSGGLIQIPTAELLAFTPDTSLGQALMEHLKVDPEAMSMKEADEFLQAHAAGFKDEVAKVVEQHGLADEFATSAEAVRQNLKGQLDTANRFTPDVNEAYASMVSSFYATQAARLNMTPEQLFAAHPLAVQAQGVTEGALMNQAMSITDTPEFKDWFGGSKVTGEDGTPLVVYHASTYGDISAFDPKEQRFGKAGYGFYFTNQDGSNLFNEYGDKFQMERSWKGDQKAPKTYPVFLHVKNPLVVDHVDDLKPYLEKGQTFGAARGIGSNLSPETKTRLQAQGYDGIITRETTAPKVHAKQGLKILDRNDPKATSFPVYVVFEPEQIKSIFNSGAFDPSNPDILNQSPAHFSYEPGLGFQSALFSTVLNAKQSKASADQWLATLQNAPGVKKEELEWIGLPEALKLMGAEGAITREQILAYVAQNGVRLEEVVQGAGYVAPTQAEIRSRAVDLAMAADEADMEGLSEEELEDWSSDNTWHDFADQAEEELREEAGGGAEASYADYQAIPGGENYRELLITMPGGQNPRLTRDFTKGMGHWDHDNVLAHTRLADFTTPDGKRVLGVLEIQSDWHQKGRDKGYSQPASQEEQDAAADAWDKARAVQDTIGADLSDRVQVLLTARLEELRALEATAREQADKPTADYPADMPAMDISRQREHAQKTVNRTVDAIFKVENNIKELGRAHYGVRGQAAASIMQREIWSGLGAHLDDQFMEAQTLSHDLRQATLKAREAEQQVERVSGQRGIPDAPFKSTWPALVMKRIIREAVEKGYDHVAWATGEQQADLYDMRETVGPMYAMRTPGDDGRYSLEFTRHGIGERVAEHFGTNLSGAQKIELNADQIKEMFGAAHAQHIMDNAGPYGDARKIELDAAIGGEGHKAFYNRNLVNITNDIIKKLGAKVGKVPVVNTTSPYAARLGELEALVAELKASADAIPADQLHAQRNVLADYAQAHEELETARTQQWGFPITDKMRAEDAAVQPKLFQGESPAQARGSFNPQTNTITLLRNADLSTFLHETGHFFLETLAKMAADDAAPQEIKDDWAKASAFIGFGGTDPAAWLAIPVDGRRDGHEKFARGFEAYLREGKAPAPQLKGVFQRFKAWMLHVYQNLAQLNVELTPEVRGVMDRLLATETDIAQAEQSRAFAPMFDTKPEGMSDLEWEAYQRLGAEATADAQDELAARSIRDMRWLQNARSRMIRALAKEAREKRQAIHAEVQAEVLAEPTYAAMQFLRRGTLNGEQAEGPHKLAIADVEALYKDTPKELQDWRKLGYGRYGMLAEEGLDPDHVAELFGFTSGDELVEALMNAEPMRAKIEGISDQRMLERYGDLTDPPAIARAADEAIHNDARLRFVATEANALAKAAGQTRILAEAARDFARDLIGRQLVRNLKPGKYTGAERRAATAAATAAAKGDLVTAATEKRNQLINGYAAKAVFQAQKEIDTALRYFARLQSEATRKGMDPDYRDQIDQLLERFDLRKGQSLKAIDKRKSLAAWIKAMQDRGLDPILDDQLVNEAYRKHFKDMSVDEVRGLVDAVKNIAHLGRLKNRLLVAARGRAFQAVVDDAEKTIRDNAYQTRPEKLEHNTLGDRLLSGVANYLAQHRKFASLIREMSGLKTDGGVLWRAFIEPMNKANDKEAAMRERATVQLMAIFKPMVDAGGLKRKMFIPVIGRSLSLEGRLAVALNWGNELNRARIMDGDKWTADQATAIVQTLTAAQLGFVNQMHEYLDSYWPEIAAKERRVTGVEPAKVEAEPYQVQSADGQLVGMRGGYYPIKYDTERSTRSEQDDIAEAVRSALQGVYTRATTRRGHTKARVDKVERPVRKDLNVPFAHVNQVIHDLSFHEYLIDANRLIAAPQIDGAIRDHYGTAVLRTIRNTIDAIAEGDTVAENQLDRVLNYIRSGSTIVGLGYNVLTALQQPLGLTQSIVRIGPKYVAHGIFRVMGDAVTLQNTVEEITGKSEFMRLRAKTMMREVAEVQNKIKGGFTSELSDTALGKAAAPVTHTLDAVQGGAFFMITKLQLIADVPTWLGAYAKAQAQGEDEDTAVGLADQAVRDSQGSGQTGDLAQIQRGSAWFKLWTSFYSFFSVGYNQMAESIGETRRVGPSRLPLLAADVALVAILPAVLGELMKRAMRGDDWDWDELGPALLKNQLSYMLGFFVFARDFGQIATSDGKNAGGPASLRIFGDAAKLYQQARQGEADDAMRKAALNVAGILFHFPAAQLNRTIDGMEAMARGDTKNPMALALGPPHKAE